MWLQIELAEPWQPWLADIRSRLGNIMRADALGEPLGEQAIVGLSDEALHRLSHPVYVMMSLSVTTQPLTVKPIQQRRGETK